MEKITKGGEEGGERKRRITQKGKAKRIEKIKTMKRRKRRRGRR